MGANIETVDLRKLIVCDSIIGRANKIFARDHGDTHVMLDYKFDFKKEEFIVYSNNEFEISKFRYPTKDELNRYENELKIRSLYISDNENYGILYIRSNFKKGDLIILKSKRYNFNRYAIVKDNEHYNEPHISLYEVYGDKCQKGFGRIYCDTTICPMCFDEVRIASDEEFNEFHKMLYNNRMKYNYSSNKMEKVYYDSNYDGDLYHVSYNGIVKTSKNQIARRNMFGKYNAFLTEKQATKAMRKLVTLIKKQ